MPPQKSTVRDSCFNQKIELPFNLRAIDFKMAMQDVYDFLYDVNAFLDERRLGRFEEMLRPASMSGFLSDMITASLATKSRSLTANQYFNGHPDLIVRGRYANDSVKAGTEGVEIKATRKRGGSVDMHGARTQWLCVFVYTVDTETEPASERRATEITEVYLAHVSEEDFRKNERGELGTRTASLHRDGMKKLREGWVYILK
jgi:hypothetical protein